MTTAFPTDPSPGSMPKPWPGERPLVLASASSIRAQMLRAAGLEISLLPVAIDEPAIRAALVAEGTSPRDVADALAQQKALKAARRSPSDALIVGADQILELDGAILSKPDSREDAQAQLLALSGRRHLLHSAAVAVELGTPVWRHVDTASLTMRPLSSSFVTPYLDRCWPAVASSVGAYQIERDGIRLFDTIEGNHFTILGFPLIPLLTWLGARGDIAT
jgi:septum formation protein